MAADYKGEQDYVFDEAMQKAREAERRDLIERAEVAVTEAWHLGRRDMKSCETYNRLAEEDFSGLEELETWIASKKGNA